MTKIVAITALTALTADFMIKGKSKYIMVDGAIVNSRSKKPMEMVDLLEEGWQTGMEPKWYDGLWEDGKTKTLLCMDENKDFYLVSGMREEDGEKVFYDNYGSDLVGELVPATMADAKTLFLKGEKTVTPKTKKVKKEETVEVKETATEEAEASNTEPEEKAKTSVKKEETVEVKETATEEAEASKENKNESEIDEEENNVVKDSTTLEALKIDQAPDIEDFFEQDTPAKQEAPEDGISDNGSNMQNVKEETGDSSLTECQQRLVAKGLPEERLGEFWNWLQGFEEITEEAYLLEHETQVIDDIKTFIEETK